MKITSRWPWILLAVIGVVIWLFTVVLHFVGFFTGHTYEIDHTVLLAGTLFGFIGLWKLNSTDTERGGAFLVTQVVKLGQLLPRFGRRSTDASAIPEATTTVEAIPVAAGRDEAEGLEPTP